MAEKSWLLRSPLSAIFAPIRLYIWSDHRFGNISLVLLPLKLPRILILDLFHFFWIYCQSTIGFLRLFCWRVGCHFIFTLKPRCWFYMLSWYSQKAYLALHFESILNRKHITPKAKLPAKMSIFALRIKIHNFLDFVPRVGLFVVSTIPSTLAFIHSLRSTP